MDADGKFAPPYNIPWATFLSTVERIAVDPPNRVDRSFLDSQSGTIQTYLIAALKAFNLINEEARPTGVLAFADPDLRKANVAELLRRYYPTIVPLGTTNSTPGELAEAFAEAFPNITGESRVKAIRFFLSAMAYAELPTAQLWGTVKAPRGASGRKTTRRSTSKGAPPPPAGTVHAAGAATSEEAMRAEYFRLLLDKAKGADDTDLLDRIERLVGISAGTATAKKRPKSAPAAPAQTDSPEGDS
jgi:hypothetical protein